MQFDRELAKMWIVVSGVCIFVFFLVISYILQSSSDWNDMHYYYSFCSQFPEFYVLNKGHYDVVYAPHFFWMFLPFTFLQESVSHLIWGVAAIGGILYLMARVEILKPPIPETTLVFFSLIGFFWFIFGNVEVVMLSGIIWAYLHATRGDAFQEFKKAEFVRFEYVMFIALFSIKIISAALLLLFLIEYDSRVFWKATIVFLVVFIGINAPFLLIAPSWFNLTFFLDVFWYFPNATENILFNILYVLTRPSCGIPIIACIVYFVRKYRNPSESECIDRNETEQAEASGFL